MWLSPIIVIIFSCASSAGISDCKAPPPTECFNTSKIDHLECLLTVQVTSFKELLQLFKENQQQLIDMRHEMENRFDHQQWALDLLVARSNSSLMTMPTCQAQSGNGNGVAVNPLAMARSTGPIDSCYDVPYTDQALLQLSDASPPFWVLCVQQHKSTGSGWVVIQQRVFGAVSFFRSWIKYREGFGALDSEFWLGLENIYRITRLQQYELLIEMTDFLGNYKFARYSRFELAGEDEEYALRQLGSYSGTAGDSLRPHVGMKFSTYDSDNEQNEARNCGIEYSSGWWFDKCYVKGTNLNGLAAKSNNVLSIVWSQFGKSTLSLKYTRMMVRAIK